MWRRAGRPGQPESGYAITNGYITLIVPYVMKERGVREAIEYLNNLEQPRTSGKRICAQCNKPMGKAHKFWFRPDGRIEHRHCDNPESYLSIENNAHNIAVENRAWNLARKSRR